MLIVMSLSIIEVHFCDSSGHYLDGMRVFNI